MDNGFKFGDKATWDFPIAKVEKYPGTKGAARKYKTYSIPGRNGDLHTDEGAFQNYIQPYECYFHGEAPTNEEAHAIKAWLLGTGGYQRLTDVYDPKYYRLAVVLDEINIANILNSYGRFTVNFSCDPRSFLLSGDDPIDFAADGTIINPTTREAAPRITVTGTGAGEVSINGVTVQIKSIDGSIILDCENENAYSLSAGAPVNENLNIYAPKFPVLAPGENSVSFTGGITAVQIVPRWWEL